MNNNKTLGITIFLALLPPLAAMMAHRGGQDASLLVTMLWVMANFLFVSTIWELFTKYHKLTVLPGLKLNHLNYITQLGVYLVFLIFINLYLYASTYAPTDPKFQFLANPLILGAILLVFFVNLLSGIFEDKTEGPKDTDIYKFSNQNSLRTGRDTLNIAGGIYDNGMIMGSLIVPFDSIKSAYTDKAQTLNIRGKLDGRSYLIAMDAPKTRDRFIGYLKDAISQGKLDADKLQLKK
ncbi:hypothetical protein O6R05_00480 [Peptoniphilus equinus]|uniref:Uncharacterized protein n=1 Tax=Peptoniphilus equinus TaxID=3016343 RepID=A0ABY7QUN8_9FIRM|nr:hypothetical protein [Peptoniphilus equinus]WBW50071.1 hypothetical protein O6R05_00480 [Peptoniphilus equinus]